MDQPPPPYPGGYYDPAYPQYPAPNQPAYAPANQPSYAYPQQGQPPQPYASPPGPYQHPQPQQYPPYGGAHYHNTQNTVVMMQPEQRVQNVTVMEDEAVNDCYMDCDGCGDNACGRCCASMWKCDKYHKWYSVNGKGIGWILVLILFYLIAGTIGLAISCVFLAAVCFCLSGGD